MHFRLLCMQIAMNYFDCFVIGLSGVCVAGRWSDCILCGAGLFAELQRIVKRPITEIEVFTLEVFLSIAPSFDKLINLTNNLNKKK